MLNPEVPNNYGSLAPIVVKAPAGSIVNAQSPSPCTARHVVGMFLPMPLLKALAQVVPEKVMAEGAGAVWTCQVSGTRADGRPFITSMFNYAGGVGARAGKPGLAATAYPTGVAAVPVEVVESTAPLRFLRKELRHGSGGIGAQPGGMGLPCGQAGGCPRSVQTESVAWGERTCSNSQACCSLCSASTISKRLMSMRARCATADIFAAGPTSTGLMIPASAASLAPRKDVSSQG